MGVWVYLWFADDSDEGSGRTLSSDEWASVKMSSAIEIAGRPNFGANKFQGRKRFAANVSIQSIGQQYDPE